MNYDYSGLYEAIKDIAKGFKGVIDFIRQTLQDIGPYLIEIARLMKDYKPKKKIKYKPVLEIRPTKIILISKKLNRYYCRSSL